MQKQKIHNRMLYSFALCSILFVLGFKPEQKKLTIWLVGDSTMSIKDPKAYPETGWGMPFAHFWDSTVVVDNRAMNGRSTRTFIEEKRWDYVTAHIKAGDYVLIQFGHNDEVPAKKSYVTAQAYKDYLTRYVAETRDKGGIPVLITPVARRKFDEAGKVVDTHTEYAQILRNVAADEEVTLIDLSAKSMSMLQNMGRKSSAYLYNHLSVGENPNYPDGKEDNTHFNELGARKMAEIVLNEVRNTIPELRQRLYIKKGK